MRVRGETLLPPLSVSGRLCVRTESMAAISQRPHWTTKQKDGAGLGPRWHFRFNPRVGKTSWRRKWQATPVFLPGKCHGRRSLVDYSPWGRKGSANSLSLYRSWGQVLQVTGVHCPWASRILVKGEEGQNLPLHYSGLGYRRQGVAFFLSLVSGLSFSWPVIRKKSTSFLGQILLIFHISA